MRARSESSGLVTLAVSLLTAVSALLVFTVLAEAQEGPSTIEFSFTNPGARSMGFGGAFAALADDATAAFANPAGLVQLARPEVSFEGRFWAFETPFTRTARVSGSPSGQGLDVVAGATSGLSSETTYGPSFLSFVYPVRQVAFAVYRFETTNFEARSETDGLFTLPPSEDGDNDRVDRFDDWRTMTEIRVVNYGVSLGVRAHERLQLGAGFAVAEGDLLSRTERFGTVRGGMVQRTPSGELTLPDGVTGPNAFPEDALEQTTDFFIDDRDLTFNLGLLWQVTAGLSFAAFHRDGANFLLDFSQRTGPSFGGGVPTDSLLFRDRTEVALPDVSGLGLAYRSPERRWIASFEWTHVGYRSIFDSLSRQVVNPEEFELRDANELHFGFEYVFVELTPVVALRSGFWLDPDHRFRYIGDDPVEQVLFPDGSDRWHFALGGGLAIGQFQIDAAMDLSALVDSLSVTAILSF